MAYVCRLTRLRSKPPVLSFSTSTDGLRGLMRTFALLSLRLCEQAGRVLQGIRAVRNPSPDNARRSAAKSWTRIPNSQASKSAKRQVECVARRGAAVRGEHQAETLASKPVGE